MENYGERLAREVSARISRPVASVAALAAIPKDLRADGQIVCLPDGSLWRFSLAATASDTSNNLVVTPDSGAGRWLRMPGAVLLAFPFDFSKADAAAHFTTPAGSLLLLRKLFWGISADFTGGAASTIGASSNKAGFNTKGDLLGGAAGDAAATLVASAGYANGTIGAKLDTVAELHTALWVPGDTIRHDRITSAFTAGTGVLYAVADLLKNAGA